MGEDHHPWVWKWESVDDFRAWAMTLERTGRIWGETVRWSSTQISHVIRSFKHEMKDRDDGQYWEVWWCELT